MGLHDRYLEVTTGTDGSGTIVDTMAIFGLLYAVEWIDGDLADGVDAVLSVINTPSAVDATLLTLTDANADDWYYPRDLAHDAVGAALTDRTLFMLNGTLKLAVTDGGDTKTGGCIVYFIN